MIGIVDMRINATLSITNQISRYGLIELGLVYLKNNRIVLGLRVRLTQSFAHEHIQEPAPASTSRSATSETLMAENKKDE
jgi:hypothetical protein